MKTLNSFGYDKLPSLFFYATLLAHGAAGCSAKTDGFVSMGGDTGGTHEAFGSNAVGGADAVGGASPLQTGIPASGGAATAGSSVLGTSTAQAGNPASAGNSALGTGYAQAGNPASAGNSALGTGYAQAGNPASAGNSALGSGPAQAGNPGIAGGSSLGTSYAQAGGGAAGASSLGGASSYVISTSVGAVKPTCTGMPLSKEQVAGIQQAAGQNSDCQHAGITAEPRLSSIMLLVDTTASMATPVQGTADTRWDVVTRGILGFTDFYSRGMQEVGIGFYGTFRETTSIPNCGSDAYAAPAIPIGQIANNQADIAVQLNALRDQLNAPPALYPALEGNLGYASSWRSNHQNENVVVVLVTDGRSQGCDKTLNDVQALVKSYAERSPETQIRTFVIGVAGAQANLDAIAESGSTNRAYLVDGPGASEQFTASLQNIVDSVRAWFMPNIGIGQVGPKDPAYVLVRDFDTQDSYVMPRVESGANCNETIGGWYYTVDSDGQSQATFCPCTRPNVFKSDVAAYYGCTLPVYPAD